MSSTAGNVDGGLAVGLLLSIAFDKLATKWVTESSRAPLILPGVTLLLLVERPGFVSSQPAAGRPSVPWRRCAMSRSRLFQSHDEG
jgi:hypothetical protein